MGCPVTASGNIFSTFTDSQTYGEEIRMEYKFDAEAVKQRRVAVETFFKKVSQNYCKHKISML